MRGASAGARGAAAGARARVERVVDRLLPHRPLARRPGRERPLPRALPQRGALGAAGHRPRLPARHPRGADPARARALRPRPLRRSWRRSPPTTRARPSATSARRSGSRRRRGGARGARGRPVGRRGASSATCPTRSGAAARARRAGARSSGSCTTRRHLPRHMTQHPGGMVISTQPLNEICPIQPAAMDGRQMVQWDKESCADAGFLKIDLLGLGMLSAVERCVDEIARTRGETIDLSRIDWDDKQVYRGDPGGGDDGRLPDREPRADADAQAHAARVARRPHRAGGARAAGADPGRRGAPLHRAAQGAARGPERTGCRTSTRRSSRCCATRSARSSSRTR